MQEDFKTEFKDILNMEIPEMISPFDAEVESENLDSFLKEFTEMTFNLETKSM